MKLKQIQEIVKAISGIETLGRNQSVPNGKSILEDGLDSFKLKSNQLILVESIESILSRSCKVKLNTWNPFRKHAKDKIKVCRTVSIYVITTIESINDIFINFHKCRDFYKSIEPIKHKLYKYKEPEYYSNADIYLVSEESDADLENEYYQSLSLEEKYEEYLDYCKYEDEIDYSGINPLSPFEYRQVDEWVEINNGDRISNEKVISKGIKGHMVMKGPTFYEDNFNFDDKGEGEPFISDIIIGDKLLSVDDFINLVDMVIPE